MNLQILRYIDHSTRVYISFKMGNDLDIILYVDDDGVIFLKISLLLYIKRRDFVSQIPPFLPIPFHIRQV